MIIAIVNQKGGTGKTTTTVNLGSALAQAGRSVLLVDFDPQGNLSYSLGITGSEQTMADVLNGDAAIGDIMYEVEGMDVAPSYIELADAEISLAGLEERELLLKKQLEALSYDYILIDCPPSLSLLTINALSAAERVIIPLQMEVLSLQGLDQIINTINSLKDVLNENLEIFGVLPTMVDRRRKLSTEIYEHIQENYELRIFEHGIRSNVRASEAPSFGQSVIQYAPSSNSANDYRAFANEILNLS